MLCERQHSLLICLLAVLLLTVRPADAASQQQPTIAIIIDDMGHNYQTGYELAALPYPITLSFLPGRRFTLALAEFAASQNKEIMLHVPMENTQGIALGIGALKRGMTEADFKESLNQSISAIAQHRTQLIQQVTEKGDRWEKAFNHCAWVARIDLFLYWQRHNQSEYRRLVAVRYGWR